MAAGPALTPRLQLTRALRERFLADAVTAVQALGAGVQDRLSALLDEPTNSREAQLRRDIWTAYKQGRPLWLEGTSRAYGACLDPPAARAAHEPAPERLELVGTDIVEKKILASRMVLAVNERVLPQLEDLRIRIKFLEGTEDLDGHDLLRPEVLVLLLVEEWERAGMPGESWPLVTEVVQRLLIEHLSRAYQQANELLIRKGVMPHIELKDRVRMPARGTGLAPAVSPAPVVPSAPAAPTASEVAGSPLARARSRAQGVIGQIRKMLQVHAGGFAGVAEHGAPSAGLAAAIVQQPAGAGVRAVAPTHYEDFSPAGMARVADGLRGQSAALKQKAETKAEKATIEVVTLMFQSILAEERIPPGIRVWFARLQMPVLKVALEDSEFFASAAHPTRLLIDRMGSCVMGFDAAGVHGSAMEAEIRRIVQVIEQYPEAGKRVYQIVLDEFQKFLAKFLTEKSATQKMVGVAQQVEQKETLAIQYTIEMRNMLRDMPVPDDIREFLFKVWAEVLAVAAVRKGPQHADTLQLKKSASDLVWAAGAKPQRTDRARVIQDLPNLLQRLRSGMTLLAIPLADQEVQLKRINETLADAFMSKTQAIAQDKIDAMAQRLGHLEDFVSEDGMGDLPLDAESMEMMLGIDTAALEVVSAGGARPTPATVAWAKELELGSWFVLDHLHQLNQVQLAWRSERKQLALFAAPSGKCFLIQAGRLAGYLQSGLLLPREEETLTVRASRDALAQIEAHPERLLS